MNKQEEKGLVPPRRFPEFRDGGEWEVKQLGELISTISPPKKLLTTDYLTDGRHPVIDQSQSYICGWTNDDDAIIDDHLPLIVFGDHTCALKLVRQPFAQGADGIKIFKPNKSVQTDFLYQSLQLNPLVMEQYKRHFSILREREVAYPDRESGEQQKIADCFTSVDELITAETQKLVALKTHKKVLMQQLFPAVGESVPRIRFPEFQDKGDWVISTIGGVGEIASGGTPSRLMPEYWNGDIPWVSTTLIDFNVIEKVNEYITQDGLNNSSTKIFPQGTILMAMYGQGKTRGKVAVLGINAAINQACAAILLNEKINKEFFFQNLAARYDEIRKISNPGGQENLSAALIKQIPFSYPAIESGEQQKIADCLASVDELIIAQTQKIVALRNHKKGLMQQLFPAIDEVGV